MVDGDPPKRKLQEACNYYVTVLQEDTGRDLTDHAGPVAAQGRSIS
jgi:hypothetical protein